MLTPIACMATLHTDMIQPTSVRSDNDAWISVLAGVVASMMAPEGKRLAAGLRVGISTFMLQNPEILNEYRRQEARKKVLAELAQGWRQLPRDPGGATIGSAPNPERPCASGLGVSPSTDKTEAQPEPSAPADVDARWRQAIVPPSVILVLGKRGSGKSALGYRLLETFRYAAKPYVVALPSVGRGLLPHWIGIVPSMEELPPRAIALVDEAYLQFHAREGLSARSREMCRILNLSRQRDQTLVFVTQEARQIDKNIVSAANVVIFKEAGLLQLRFDRLELATLAERAKAAFSGIRGARSRWSFVYSPDTDFVGMVENELPSFWKPGLSRVFASGGELASGRRPRAATLEDKVRRAQELRAGGASYREIGTALGVTKTSAINYVRGYYRGRAYRAPEGQSVS